MNHKFPSAAHFAAALEAANRKSQHEGFVRFLADPAVKYILSTMPAGPQDALMTLMRKSFYDGHTCGGTAAMGVIVEHATDVVSKGLGDGN